MYLGVSTSAAFDAAVQEFQDSLDDDDNHYNLTQFRSINDVYDEADRIQREQGTKGALRDLNRIKPFLERLLEFAGVIDVIVQVKPDVLALIWGPIKLLLQASCTFIRSFDKILDTMVKIGDCLPRFKEYEDLFKNKPRVSHVLCLFYQDILDFYVTCLKFFKVKGWKVFFESLWPRHGDKIALIQVSIERHKLLLDGEVTVSSISDAYAAHALALKEYEKNQKHREQQEFESLKVSLSPRTYDADLEAILERRCNGTSQWLFEEDMIKKWRNCANDAIPLIWLNGIPGAGKTHLSASIVQDLMRKGSGVVFAFLNYQESTQSLQKEMIRSFIFQILYEVPTLRPIIQKAYSTNYRQLHSSMEFSLGLFCDIIKSLDRVHVVIDGLDEIVETERRSLLKNLLELMDKCPNLRVLISSRKEADIERALRTRAQILSIEQKNSRDIRIYADKELRCWLAEEDIASSDSTEVEDFVQVVTEKSHGMFLYARLVMDHLRSQPNLEELKKELHNLPHGLEEAYGRITARIDKKLTSKERLEVRRILQWIACSKSPLRKQELLQALQIKPGDRAIVPERKLLRDVFQLCGPIIETRGEHVVFVHFTVKEFLCGPQSNYWIQEKLGHREIAMVCMLYLGFDHFRGDLKNNIILGHILNGNYILLTYAESYWLKHVIDAVKARSEDIPLEDLYIATNNFFEAQDNPLLRASIAQTSQRVSKDFVSIPEEWHAVAVKLSRIQSLSRSTQTMQNAAQVQNMNNEDLLLVNQISSRIRDLIDSIACDPLPHREGCHCLRLQEHYGAFIFKCQKRHCPFFQQGFQHRADRYRHMKQHERLYKCEITTCDFSHLGFESVDDLQKHTAICHPSERILITQETIESCLDESEKHQTLHGAIEAGRADLVEVILNLISNPPWRELMKSAISGTSVEVLQVLKQAASSRAESSTQSPWIFEKPVWHAVNTASIEVLTYLVANNADINQIERVRNYSGTTIFATPLMKAACMGRIEAVRLFLASTPTIDATCALQELLCPKSGCPVYYEQFPSHIHPIDIVATTSALLDHGTIDIDQIPLTLLADGICNVEVGELLIDYGADVNVKVDGYTPLYLALRKNSGKRSACFAKMLLENGADPTVPCGPGNKRFCKGLAGARNIAKFVDVDFETVVSRTWGFNQNG